MCADLGTAGNGEEIFPSQAQVLDSNSKKSKLLCKVDGVAAMHSQKVGNALRISDSWHTYADFIGAIAVEPYGAMTSRDIVCRQPKEKRDFYTLLDSWVIKEQKPSVEQRHYVMAVLFRGGVLGEKEDTMVHYQAGRVLPDPEFSEPTLLAASFSWLHRALAA